MAYNEAANIANAIGSLLRQRSARARLAEIIVVASGCTDDTVPIVRAIASSCPQVRLIVQERREGKAAAINVFLREARSPILLMTGGDILLKDGTLDLMLEHLRDPTVGMVGAHPIPVNDEESFLGYAVHLLWRLHDRVARHAPKLGEVVAFRNVVPEIPLDTAVDEISIQALISHLGYRLVYEPRAIVYNRGPTTVRDFLRQRRRIYAGHLQIRKQQGYAAPTISVWRVGRALLGSGALAAPGVAWWTLCAVGLEAFARALGYYDFRRHRSHHVWNVAGSTKSHIAEAAEVQIQESVLVFRIIDFHQHELEHGARFARLLTQAVLSQVRRALGTGAVVTAERGGTIVAVVPTEREQAEQTAESLIRSLEAAPLQLNGHDEQIAVQLACGIITFSRTGQPLALAIPATVLGGPATQ